MTSLRHKQRGAATLILTTVILVMLTLIVIFAANYSTYQQKISANFNRNNQAFEAAEAGLEFGIVYLQQNSSTILANPINGYIPAYSDSNTSNVSLSNGSKYTITYTNPVANNYTLITITSTGVSDDGTATRIVSQQVQFGSVLMSSPTFSGTAKGNATLGGTTHLTNTDTNLNVKSGGSTSISGLAFTTTTSGTISNATSIGADVQQNLSSLANLSSNDLFASFFAASMTSIKSRATYTYSNLGNYSSQLSGKSAAIIWIDDSNAVVNGNIIVGSPTNPVLVIVNGSLTITGNPVIFGVIYSTNTITDDATGSATIYGAMITGGNLDIRGHTNLIYNLVIINNLRNGIGNYYAKIPGTWRDF